MQTLEQIDRQIETVSDLRSLLKTMRALSAVAIGQLEDVEDGLSGYERSVHLGLRALSDHITLEDVESRQTGGPHTLVVIGPERGFCGRHHERLAGLCDEQIASGQTNDCLAIGSRLSAAMEEAGIRPALSLSLPGTPAGLGALSNRLLEELGRLQQRHPNAEVSALYMRRAQSGGLRIQETQLWPISPKQILDLAAIDWPSKRLPQVPGDKTAILGALLRQVFRLSILKACLSGMIAEHGARLVNLQATDENIGAYLGKLEQQHHTRRQNDITAELMDIQAGFNMTGIPDLLS